MCRRITHFVSKENIPFPSCINYIPDILRRIQKKEENRFIWDLLFIVRQSYSLKTIGIILLKDLAGILQWTYLVIANCSAVFFIFLILCVFVREKNIKIATQVRREGQLTCLTNNSFGFYLNLRKVYFFTLGHFGKVMRKFEPLVTYNKDCY